MSGKTAAILGVTGMTGTYLLETLLQDNYFETVRVLVRRPLEKKDPRMEVKLVDFNDAESVKLALEGTDTIFCCIGTTQKKVKGNKELYRQIDFDIPLRAARFGKEAGCEQFIIISAVGANSKSGNFYLKLKGDVEEALQQVNIQSVYAMEPSMLLGDRKDHRGGEGFLQGTMKLLSGILVGSLRKYKAIQSKTLALGMLNAAKKEEPGFHRCTYDAIRQLAATSDKAQ